MLKKLRDANHFISQKLNPALILQMQQTRTNMSGILQYLHKGRTNDESKSEAELITIPSSIRYLKLTVELFNRIDASIPVTSITYESKVELSVSNEAPFKIVFYSLESHHAKSV